jgi:predicted acyltransferase
MTTSVKKETKERLYSLDTLRGFDMFWIIGGGSLLGALAKATEWHWVEVLAEQMHHVAWEGFRFEDLIFPLFMFISGVAIPFSLISRLEKGVEKSVLHKKVFKRMVLLVFFGLIYNGVLKNGFSDPRYLSVLSQIGIGYFFASVIVINTKTIKARIFWLIGIMAGITILQLFTPVPGFGAGVLTPEGSINAWIDQKFLPGRLIYGTYDPEGVLCIVSATSVTLMGAFAGFILRNKEYTQNKKTIILLIAGAALVLVALLLSPVYPIIKNIWTVPFNILTAGISFLLIAIFYYIIDVKMWRSWIFFFRVIGLNSITIYLGVRIVDFWHSSGFLLGWLANPIGDYGRVIIVIGVISFEWLLLYYLYKKKIFLRV